MNEAYGVLRVFGNVEDRTNPGQGVANAMLLLCSVSPSSLARVKRRLGFFGECDSTKDPMKSCICRSRVGCTIAESCVQDREI